MSETTLVIRKNRIDTKGKTLIYIRYTHDSKSCYFSTGEKIPADAWNDKTKTVQTSRLVKIRKGSSENLDLAANVDNRIYELIDSQKAKLVAIVLEQKRLNKPLDVEAIKEIFLKSTIENGEIISKQFDILESELIDQFEKFTIKYQNSPGTYNTYKTTLNRLIAFQQFKKKVLTISDLNIDFYDSFISFLQSGYSNKVFKDRPLKNSSIGTTIKCLKTFISSLQKRKLLLDIDKTHFKVDREANEVVSLEAHEYIKLRDFDFENKSLEKARDLFILNCNLGLRYDSDLTRLDTHNFKGKEIFMKTKKAKKNVQIPLFNDAKKVLEKYEYKVPFLSLTNMNKFIKEACKVAGIDQMIEVEEKVGGGRKFVKMPKYQKITTHTAIKTYITACDKVGMPIKLISDITGKSVEIITKHYLGLDRSVIQKYANTSLYV